MDVNDVVAILSDHTKRARKAEDQVGWNQHVEERIFLQPVRRAAFVRQRLESRGRVTESVDLQSVDAMIAQAKAGVTVQGVIENRGASQGAMVPLFCAKLAVEIAARATEGIGATDSLPRSISLPRPRLHV